MKYALDTNTIIRLLRKESFTRQKFGEVVEQGTDIVIPPLVHYEMRRGFLCKFAPAKEKSYNILIEQCPVGEMSGEVLERGAVIYSELYRMKRIVDDTDLLIAAFCVVGGYILVTNNIKHFEVIDGLRIEDWSMENGSY